LNKLFIHYKTFSFGFFGIKLFLGLNKNFGVERTTPNKKIQTENKIFPHKKETVPKASFKIIWE
jgi:hypothetical protein